MITLAFTRPERRLKDSVRIAEGYGFNVLAAPSLDIVHGDKASYEKIGLELSQKAFSTIIFSSATAVEECREEWDDRFKGMMDGTEVIAIGPGTSRRLEGLGIKVSSIPEEFTSSGLVDLLKKDTDGRNVLIIHSDKGSSVLKDGLIRSGFAVEELIAYTLEKHEGGLDAIRDAITDGKVDAVAFTSRLSVESFMDSIGLDKKIITSNVKVAAIGRPTMERLEDEGIKVDILPKDATFECLLQTIKDYFAKEGKE